MGCVSCEFLFLEMKNETEGRNSGTWQRHSIDLQNKQFWNGTVACSCAYLHTKWYDISFRHSKEYYPPPPF
jgi:hypothetical protein